MLQADEDHPGTFFSPDIQKEEMRQASREVTPSKPKESSSNNKPLESER